MTKAEQMKVVDIERVVILMRFIQFGWDEDRKKRFDDNLKMMLETQCEDLEEHDAKVRADAIDECIEKLYEVTPQTIDEKLDMVFVNALKQLKEQLV